MHELLEIKTFSNHPFMPIANRTLGELQMLKTCENNKTQLLQIMIDICMYKVMYLFCIFCKIQKP